MPLIFEKPRSDKWPARWERLSPRSVGEREEKNEPLKIALVNNMPDAALEDTEVQFFDLISAAAGEIPILVSLYSLPQVPRGDRGREHIAELYSGIERLWSDAVDCAIVTGTEPRHPDLRQEPYWRVMTELFEWAERNTFSAVLSCLAAHAAVLHADGVARRPQAEKLFGIFEERRIHEHPLLAGVAGPLRFPHSRWNDIGEGDLVAAGYQVLTSSAAAGVGLFVKRKQKSLFVHFQGHPEYARETLLKEYRRDVGRYLRHERESYPELPRNYFGDAAERALVGFRAASLACRSLEMTREFPDFDNSEAVRDGWRAPASQLYGNWLRYVWSRKEESALASVIRPQGSHWPNAAASL